MDPYNSGGVLPAGGHAPQPPMMSSNANPYAAPGAAVRDMRDEADVVLATRLARLGAALIDSAIFAVPAMLAAIMLPAYQDYARRAAGGAASASLGGGTSIMLMVLGLAMIALAVMQFVLLYRHGQTVGKKIVGIRIVRPDGGRASFPRLLFLRYGLPGLIGAIPLVGLVFSVINVLFIFGEERRCLHDRIADTIVVNV
jgi:uncharacterized RDD family membrane protein YckC